MRRPALALLAAVAAGSAAGLAWPGGARALALVAGLCAAVAVASSVRGAGGRRAALLALVAACCALRAAAAGPGALASDDPTAAFAGRWEPRDPAREEVGALAGTGGSFELPPGAARAGELLVLAPGRASPLPAAGQGEDGPERRLPRPVLRDELVRAAPAPGGPWPALSRALAGLREAALARVSTLQDGTARGLAAALLLGDRSPLAPGVADLFTRTGTRHALAVSGLHAGLVAWVVVWPLGALLARLSGLGRRGCGREVFRALLLALFVPLAGAGAPVVRAALALSLALLAPALPVRAGGGRRRADALSLWAVAATLECLASPRALGSLSLQLSYGATLGLILGARGATERVRSLLPARGRLPETVGLGRRVPAAVRVPLQRGLDLAVAALGVSLAANLATLPLVWARFGEWSPAGLVATPLLVPLLTLFLATGWLWLALPLPALAAVLELAGSAMLGLLGWFDRLAATPAPLPPRPLWLLLGLAAAGLALLRSPSGTLRSTARAWLARSAAAAGAVALLPWVAAPGRLEVVALDVGHGTACLVRAPGAPCWIFDAGSRDRPGVAGEVLDLLARWDVGRVAVCLSHADRDHDSALGWILERHPPKSWLGALPARSAERLPHGVPRLDLRRGATELAAAPGLELVLMRGGPFEGNEGSRCLAIRWGGERVLLCGDAEAEGLRALLPAEELVGPFDLVLQPHHGSDTDLLGPFLERARPARVWISGAEVPGTARELDRRGIPWSATALEGALVYPPRTGAVPEAARFVRIAPPHPSASTRSVPARRPTGAARGARRVPRKEPLMQTTPRTVLSLAVALAASAAWLPARAHAGAYGDEPAAERRDERAAERNRVLELSSGDLLRAKTRFVADPAEPDGGRWEMRERGAWRPLRPGTVVGWRDERDLLREARRLAKELGRDDHARRVGLAEWMVTHGLEEEAVQELDRVLTAEPDHDAALGLVARAPFARPAVGHPGLDPEGVRERLIALGTSLSPTRREILIEALRELDDAEGVRVALERELVAYRHRQRVFAAHAMRRLMPGEELRPLLMRAALDNTSEVRLAAALALRASGNEAVVVPLVRALSSENGRVRTNVAEALGHVGFEAAVPALVNHMVTLAQGGGPARAPAGNITITNEVAYVQDFDVEIAQGASIADPVINVVTEGVVLEGRAYGMQEHSLVTEFQTVRSSLKLLTGQDAGNNPDKWQRWYEQNRTR